MQSQFLPITKRLLGTVKDNKRQASQAFVKTDTDETIYIYREPHDRARVIERATDVEKFAKKEHSLIYLQPLGISTMFVVMQQ